MASSINIKKTSIVLNRFFVKQLAESDLTVSEYTCTFTEHPDRGQEQKAIASICYKVGVPAIRLGNKIITKESICSTRLQGDGWEVKFLGTRVLDCKNPAERKGIEQIERKILEQRLKQQWDKTAIEKASEGGLIWWITGEAGIEKFGIGWEVHRGRRIDVSVDTDSNLYLEIDLHHRFYTPWTLHEWQEEYPEVPISYVRNTYKDKNNKYITWKYEDISEQTPEQVLLEGLGITLADYHRQNGATEEEVKNSRVVSVKRANDWKNQLVYHLSQRLSPSLTMDMLANIAENFDTKEKKNIQGVFEYIKKAVDVRLKESQKTARQIIENIYGLSTPTQASVVDGFILPKGKLFAKNGEVDKTGKVRYQGCVKVGEVKFGCLNLFNNQPKYPAEVEKCLKEVAKSSGAEIEYDSYRTLEQMPQGELDRQMFWQEWAQTGIQTILVVAPWLKNSHKRQIRVEALQAGIATQFILPAPNPDPYKAMNVVLGLLCKAGWQTVRLEPLEHPESAELIIGFDTGTNRELYYGTSAFAVLADGQSLGWELPDVQRGESFSGQGVWQTVSKLVLKFYKIYERYPKRILLMRDGLVQEGEFQQTIEALTEKNIAIDLVSVRKSGAGRMGREISQSQNEDKIYRDAEIGSVVFMPKESSFILVTSQPINQNIGSVRPLRVVHEYGDTSLEILALQTYHLTQLHPASGFRSCRLPWVLHLADRSSKEFQRIGQISILQNISREKLIAV